MEQYHRRVSLPPALTPRKNFRRLHPAELAPERATPRVISLCVNSTNNHIQHTHGNVKSSVRHETLDGNLAGGGQLKAIGDAQPGTCSSTDHTATTRSHGGGGTCRQCKESNESVTVCSASMKSRHVCGTIRHNTPVQ